MEIITSYERKGIEKGIKIGEKRGVKLGKQEGIKIGKQKEAAALISRQLTRRLGAISARLQKRIEKLSLAELEALSEALLDFSEVRDLTAWLKKNPF